MMVQQEAAAAAGTVLWGAAAAWERYYAGCAKGAPGGRGREEDAQPLRRLRTTPAPP